MIPSHKQQEQIDNNLEENKISYNTKLNVSLNKTQSLYTLLKIKRADNSIVAWGDTILISLNSLYQYNVPASYLLSLNLCYGYSTLNILSKAHCYTNNISCPIDSVRIYSTSVNNELKEFYVVVEYSANNSNDVIMSALSMSKIYTIENVKEPFIENSNFSYLSSLHLNSSNDDMTHRLYDDDFNTIVDPGLYVFGSVPLGANRPVALTGQLEVRRFRGIVTQIYTVWNGENIFIRGAANNATSWTTWKKYTGVTT